MNDADWERVRRLLCRMGDDIRDVVLAAREAGMGADFARISAVTDADTIYQVDKISEEAIFSWFSRHWPEEWPVELVMEGVEEGDSVVFPEKTSVRETLFKLIIDPVDGTRNLMYDKRSAWILTGLAPQKGQGTRLNDILVAAMTEIPVTKQTFADQVSALRGRGSDGLVSERIDLREKKREQLLLQPSRARDFKHGFSSIVRFFPEGKSLLARMEEELWEELYGLGSSASPLIFDDQYISTGGQFYELLVGHDRMIADLRPPALRKLDYVSSLVCHPYDVCTALILTEAGVIFESPEGGPVDIPLDTVSPVCWVGYANEELARQTRPILKRLMEKYL